MLKTNSQKLMSTVFCSAMLMVTMGAEAQQRSVEISVPVVLSKLSPYVDGVLIECLASASNTQSQNQTVVGPQASGQSLLSITTAQQRRLATVTVRVLLPVAPNVSMKDLKYYSCSMFMVTKQNKRGNPIAVRNSWFHPEAVKSTGANDRFDTGWQANWDLGLAGVSQGRPTAPTLSITPNQSFNATGGSRR